MNTSNALDFYVKLCLYMAVRYKSDTATIGLAECHVIYLRSTSLLSCGGHNLKNNSSQK